MNGRELSGVKGPAVAASYLFVVFFNILRIERLVVSGRTVGRVEEEAGREKERENGRQREIAEEEVCLNMRHM